MAESGGFKNVHDTSNEDMIDCEQHSTLGTKLMKCTHILSNTYLDTCWEAGTVSKTMLCQCAYNADGDMVGVVQAINKRHGVFTKVCIDLACANGAA